MNCYGPRGMVLWNSTFRKGRETWGYPAMDNSVRSTRAVTDRNQILRAIAPWNPTFRKGRETWGTGLIADSP
jgi:hypothetical protein